MKKWLFAVDRGGTFTDVVGLDPEGNFHTLKLLSRSPDYDDASIEGIRRIIGTRRGVPLPEDKIQAIRFGSTIATNALLERKGGRIALLVTKGFSDLLEIGYQSRPEIFSLCIRKPTPLYSEVIEVDERIGPGGEIVRKIDLTKLERDIEKLLRESIDSIAVVFMHSWKNPAHELLCESLLRRLGVSQIYLSHRTMNMIKIVTRGQSTVVDAYLSPVIESYINGIRDSVGDIRTEFIQSSGGLTAPDSFRGKDAILSGPAGGVIAVSSIVEELGLKGAIGFDMGGTSTDVSRFEGNLEKVYEHEINGIELQTEMLNIVTIASGGGSILWFDGQRMRVGPESAGAYPGPACYGFGGPLTVTDANLLTGRIIPGYFPKAFGHDRSSPPDIDIVKEKFEILTEEINKHTGVKRTSHETALGFLNIANERMAMAIKEISVSKGFDVREYALVCFGGAGGQHACQVASLLGIERIIYHPLSSVMSAYGIGLARQTRRSVMTLLEPYSIKNLQRVEGLFRQMEEEILRDGKDLASLSITREIDLRPEGTETYLTVEYRGYEETYRRFKKSYTDLFGFFPEEKVLEAVNLRVHAEERGTFFPGYAYRPSSNTLPSSPLFLQKVVYAEGSSETPVYSRESLMAGQEIDGPAFVVDRHSTLVIEPGFKASVDQKGIITVQRVSEEVKSLRVCKGRPDPVLLEVFNNLFMGIATEMGHTLRNTAHSVNIKERLDYSCAIFDGSGNLVANAPHIPVHLGSMSDTVKAIIEDHWEAMKPGDVYLTNNPYRGGSHLPDLTVVCPVFSEKGEIIFFTASRGHHSDIGGITPGSLPPVTNNIDEEGVLIEGIILVRDAVFMEEDLRRIFSTHRYPVRSVDERISDLKAQIASCYKGVKELRGLIDRYGWDTVREYMGYIQSNAEYSVRKVLSRFLDNGASYETSFEDHLDDGTRLSVRIVITAGENPPETVNAIIDFSGTGDQHTNDNLNTPLSVTRSALLYVIRSLMETDIPLNSGCLRPVEIIVPEGSVLNPSYPLPVASGNVETSQRIVDVLLGAFGVAAASQGTMNNLLFEVEGSPPYYETIGGGAGAMDGCPGASGVQVHMTNTRITDPEVIEHRYPGVRLRRFSIRKGSGGRGLQHGGDGLVREITFLKPATISIISERRSSAPYGLSGGEPGKRGINLLERAGGYIERLGHRTVVQVNSGDTVIIRTPGGGGYGKQKGGQYSG
jgi:5-oxoprolinase (ATP-hydrolysing)